ncbi:hypothetical protein KPL70_014037 [Citrus sinensis]|nr:hypothetical protein KPL70_014037 [Citrus sinensis]
MKGSRRLRKMKERYAVTDMKKLANRMQFGVAEESSFVNGLGEGYGMLGQAGSSKIRVFVAQMKLAAKVAKKFKEKHYGSSDATSGRKSRLAFTPVQWLELSIPQAHAQQLGSGSQKKIRDLASDNHIREPRKLQIKYSFHETKLANEKLRFRIESARYNYQQSKSKEFQI